MNRQRKVVGAVLIGFVGMFALYCSESPTKSKNQKPIIQSVTATPDSLDWGESSQLVVVATDPEGTSLSFNWEAARGTFMTPTTNDTVIWQAPMASGNFNCTVTVGDGKNTVKGNIQLAVTEHPILSVSPSNLDFGPVDTVRTLRISNTGSGVLNWSISWDQLWFSVSPDTGSTLMKAGRNILSGVLAPLATDTVTVVVDRTGLPYGTYSGELNITSDGGSANIYVEMAVAPPGLWIAYDDGGYEDEVEARPEYYYFLVRFDRPAGWHNFKVTKVKIKFNTSGSDAIKLRCYGTVYDQGHYWPDPNQLLYAPAQELDPVSGWNEWDVDWFLNNSRFCVGYFQLKSYAPDLYFDLSSPDVRSYLVYEESGSLYCSLFSDIDWAIRVYVEPTGMGKINMEGLSGSWLDGSVAPDDFSRKGMLLNSPDNIIYRTMLSSEIFNNDR